MSQSSDLWQFTDNFRPHMYRDGTESFPIQSENHLRMTLEKYAKEKPRVVILEGNFGQLFIGVGGPVAAVEYYAIPGNHHAVTAKAGQTPSSEENWFVSEGEPSRFKYVMPIPTMIELVLRFFRTGIRPDFVEWI